VPRVGTPAGIVLKTALGVSRILDDLASE
jgi:hypothetical protein